MITETVDFIVIDGNVINLTGKPIERVFRFSDQAPPPFSSWIIEITYES